LQSFTFAENSYYHRVIGVGGENSKIQVPNSIQNRKFQTIIKKSRRTCLAALTTNILKTIWDSLVVKPARAVLD
jgi:hypothetical protein